MQEPAFKPEHWVMYQQEENGGYGWIVGASYGTDGWNYSVSGVLANGNFTVVREAEITHVLENNSWVAPSHLGGHGSAYTDGA